MTSYTGEQYETLCQMIAKGVTSMDLGNGEKVQFRSLTEMLRIKSMMEAELGLNPKGRSRATYPVYRRG
ncbi:hypothetical protein IQ03_00573 [Gemmobacter caeni]|uniref:GpW protein n=1 Tax=Gemmobacter caeni TaxID=589035 RepID=A0A2T6A4H1_9RHOB|nr:hypothetical protein [Gemmobacter caeni]PTX38713.1 hypothetical protein C8N34_1417 [Gemmobacter caeni]TWJ05765.1 hypothetical protein IQ03_00573 [Gemmobacter caeni]